VFKKRRKENRIIFRSSVSVKKIASIAYQKGPNRRRSRSPPLQRKRGGGHWSQGEREGGEKAERPRALNDVVGEEFEHQDVVGEIRRVERAQAQKGGGAKKGHRCCANKSPASNTPLIHWEDASVISEGGDRSTKGGKGGSSYKSRLNAEDNACNFNILKRRRRERTKTGNPGVQERGNALKREGSARLERVLSSPFLLEKNPICERARVTRHGGGRGRGGRKKKSYFTLFQATFFYPGGEKILAGKKGGRRGGGLFFNL